MRGARAVDLEKGQISAFINWDQFHIINNII